MGSGIILSSGNITDYGDGAKGSSGNTTNIGGVNASPASAGQEALLDTITDGGLDHYDVTQLDLTFDVAGDVSNIFFNVVFGSDEYAEFVGSSFIDAFGIYLNGTNIATFAGDPVNIDHPNMAFIGGTELDGILDPTSGSSEPIGL
ncbi:MAG: choice-of-anchor L domain-containing protein [Alphaproteobacteria bacterium]